MWQLKNILKISSKIFCGLENYLDLCTVNNNETTNKTQNNKKIGNSNGKFKKLY